MDIALKNKVLSILEKSRSVEDLVLNKESIEEIKEVLTLAKSKVDKYEGFCMDEGPKLKKLSAYNPGGKANLVEKEEKLDIDKNGQWSMKKWGINAAGAASIAGAFGGGSSSSSGTSTTSTTSTPTTSTSVPVSKEERAIDYSTFTPPKEDVKAKEAKAPVLSYNPKSPKAAPTWSKPPASKPATPPAMAGAPGSVKINKPKSAPVMKQELMSPGMTGSDLYQSECKKSK